MRNLKLVVEYDGTDFAGWQAQAHGVRTVQGAIEDVLARVLRERPKMVAAGRTDTGCHATGQVASFRTAAAMSLPRLARALTGLLPPDVTVVSLAEVPEAFHARFSAQERRYRYRMLERPSAVWARRAWWPWMPLDPEALTRAFRPCLGENDFRAFAGKDPGGAAIPHGRCRVTHLEFVRWDEGVALEVHANRFLYHMVRNLVGTATAITKGTRRAEDVAAILASLDRRRAGPTAPPHGLTFESVVYPEALAPIGPVFDATGKEIA